MFLFVHLVFTFLVLLVISVLVSAGPGIAPDLSNKMGQFSSVWCEAEQDVTGLYAQVSVYLVATHPSDGESLNPFNSVTKIKLDLPSRALVRFSFYALLRPV